MTAQAQPYKCREQPARQQEVTTTGVKRGAREEIAPGPRDSERLLRRHLGKHEHQGRVDEVS